MPEFDPAGLSVDDADLAVLIFGAYGTLEVPFLILSPCWLLSWRFLVGGPQDFLLIDVLANHDHLEDEVKVSSDHGLDQVPLVEETSHVLFEVFSVLILGRQQVPEDAVLTDLHRAELLVELVVTHLDAKLPLCLAVLHGEQVDAQRYDSLRQAVNVGDDLVVLLVKRRFWGVRDVLAVYVLQLQFSVNPGGYQSEVTLDLIPDVKALSYF